MIILAIIIHEVLDPLSDAQFGGETVDDPKPLINHRPKLADD